LRHGASQRRPAGSDPRREVVGTRGLGDVRFHLVARPGAACRLRERRERRPEHIQWIGRLPGERGAAIRQRHGDAQHPRLAERRGPARGALRPLDARGVRWQEGSGDAGPGRGLSVLSADGAALQRLGPTPAARRAKAPTPREQAYLETVEILYGDGSKTKRDTAYSLALERLVASFPADREAQVFYALSLLGLSQGVRDVPTYLRAAAIAEKVFRDNPNHPGAAHLLIHCYDDPI